MKMLYAGNENPYFLNSNVFRRRAFESLGHEVVFFEDRKFVLPQRIRQACPRLARWDLRHLNAGLLKTVDAEKPQLCFIVGGSRTLPETLAGLKARKIQIALLTTDAPREFFDHIAGTAPLYDFVFCSGTEAMTLLKDRGVSRTHWIPYACDPQYHRPVELTEQERAALSREVAFVGSYYPNREETLKAAAGFHLGIWGPNWKYARDPHLKRLAVDKRVNWDEWTKIYSAAQTVAVVHFNDGKTLCHQASPKLYEAMACKRLVLVDRQKDAETLFEHKTHVVFFDDPRDLARQTAYYLAHPQEREAIAERGYREVIARHTYRQRAESILRIING